MRRLETFSLAAVAAMALSAVALAGTATATELFDLSGTMGFGSTLDFSIASGGSASLVATGGESLDTCKESTIQGTVTSAGSSTSTTEVRPTGLTWAGCTFPTKTVSLELSKLEVHYISGTKNGTVTSEGASILVTVNTVFFGSCIYEVAPFTDVGTLTGYVNAFTPAKLDVNAVVSKNTGSNFACPLTARWTGTYVGTSPANLEVRAS